MNPYGPSGDIFRTTADQGANNFTDPFNVAHLYPGWGVNPNLRTPAHDAPYRPAYQGPNPYAAYERPGMLGAISQLYSPFYKDAYFGNPVDTNRSAYESLAYRPMDAAASIGQNFIAPMVTLGVTQAVLGGVGRSIGSGLGMGVARGLGASMGTASWVGGKVGMFGSFAIPIGIGLAATEAIDQAVFQPYIRSRQLMDSVRNSFSGMTFQSGGNSISGRGLSAYQSGTIGSQIDRAGIMDMTFGANQYGAIGSMGMRAGLFDDIGNAGDITKRVSSIAAQIKTIVAISKDPNIQTAIEELAKLRTGGASISGGVMSQANAAYSSMGMFASAAGMSVQRLMGQVGMQGQYMFQMNGMTPYLGQMAAGNAMAGFATAERSGLLSRAQMARMGGAEGATQSALAAQLSGSQTQFNNMGLANRFFGGGSTSGVTNTVSAFGSLAAGNPVKLMGQMMFHGGAMRSQQMSEEGALSLENQAVEYLRSIGRPAGANGYDPYEIMMAMTGPMGIGADEVKAYANLRRAQTDPKTAAMNIRAFEAQGDEQLRSVISQHGMYSGVIGTAVAGIRKVGKFAVANTADVLSYPVTRAAGAISDFYEKTTDSLMFGTTISKSPTTSLNMKAIGSKLLKSRSRSQTNHVEYELLEAINDAALKGGPGEDIARQLLAEGFDTPKGKKLFAEFLKSRPEQKFKDAYDSLTSSTGFYDRVSEAARGNIERPSDRPDLSGGFDNLRVLGQAAEVFSSGTTTLDINEVLKDPKYSELTRALGNRSDADKLKTIRDWTIGTIESGYASAANIAKGMMTPDEVMRNPERFTSDPKLRKEIREAGGDAAKVKQIMQKELANRNGGAVSGRATRVQAGAGQEGIAAVFQTMTAAGDRVAQANRESKSPVDWGSITSNFGSSVDKFDRAIDRLAARAMNYQDANFNQTRKN